MFPHLLRVDDKPPVVYGWCLLSQWETYESRWQSNEVVAKGWGLGIMVWVVYVQNHGPHRDIAPNMAASPTMSSCHHSFTDSQNLGCQKWFDKLYKSSFMIMTEQFYPPKWTELNIRPLKDPSKKRRFQQDFLSWIQSCFFVPEPWGRFCKIAMSRIR